MSLILNIDTAFNKASVSLSQNGDVKQYVENNSMYDHASWLHPAIESLLIKNNSSINEIKAIAVNNGPGSYTGLRVGLSTAKGLCFSLQIPLITVNALKLLAYAVKDAAVDLIVPMIDARRMEVFTAVYDKKLNEVTPPHALILDAISFASILETRNILFCGNAIQKAEPVIKSAHAKYSMKETDSSHLAALAFEMFQQSQFADLAYADPFYVKEFYSPAAKK